MRESDQVSSTRGMRGFSGRCGIKADSGITFYAFPNASRKAVSVSMVGGTGIEPVTPRV